MSRPDLEPLDHRARLELAVADGLATEAERAELVALGGSVDDHRELSEAIALLLRPAFIPELAASVMGRIEPEQAERDERLSQLLSELLAAGESPEMAAEILASLDLGEDALPGLLQEAMATPPVDLSSGIYAALGLPDDARDEDGDEDEGAEVVAFPLAAPAPAASPAASALASGVERPVADHRARWGGLAAVISLAAAAVLAVMVSQPADESFELASVNTVAIEELLSGDQVFVQVMQMDEGAPTIIYIDELSDDAGGIPL